MIIAMIIMITRVMMNLIIMMDKVEVVEAYEISPFTKEKFHQFYAGPKPWSQTQIKISGQVAGL